MKKARKKKPQTKKRVKRAGAKPIAKPVGWPRSSLDPTLRMGRMRHEDDSASNAGQSGDTTLISDIATADSESVKDLVEEGQNFEAEIISGVERAGDAEEVEVKPRRRKEESDT